VGGFRAVVMSAGVPPSLGEIHYHLRLELDINTSPEFVGTIPKERARDVFADLVQGATEISERGTRF
jgi:hypothetical protein